MTYETAIMTAHGGNEVAREAVRQAMAEAHNNAEEKVLLEAAAARINETRSYLEAMLKTIPFKRKDIEL